MVLTMSVDLTLFSFTHATRTNRTLYPALAAFVINVKMLDRVELNSICVFIRF